MFEAKVFQASGAILWFPLELNILHLKHIKVNPSKHYPISQICWKWCENEPPTL